LGCCCLYEIDYVYRFNEDDDEKDFFFWVGELMKIMKKRMEGEGRR